MFVSESSLNLMGTKLQVMSSDGHLWEGQPDLTMKISELKVTLVQYFYPEAAENDAEHFRLMCPGQSRTLQDNHTLEDENVKANDLLMLIRRRVGVGPQEGKEEMKAPTAQDILEATKHLAEPESGRKEVPASAAPGTSVPHRDIISIDDSNGVDFQIELRKILISLVSVMSVLLKGDPETDRVCRQMQVRLRRRLVDIRKPIEGSPFQYPEVGSIECTPVGILRGITEVRRREFRPNVKAVEGLREMGYKDDQIVSALRKARNVREKASEIIASGKLDTPDDDELGLDTSSHLYSALVSAPTIRLGLMNPKILTAFLNILDGSSPTAANVWLNDSETSPVISCIFKIYHAEKHAAPDE